MCILSTTIWKYCNCSTSQTIPCEEFELACAEQSRTEVVAQLCEEKEIIERKGGGACPSCYGKHYKGAFALAKWPGDEAEKKKVEEAEKDEEKPSAPQHQFISDWSGKECVGAGGEWEDTFHTSWMSDARWRK